MSNLFLKYGSIEDIPIVVHSLANRHPSSISSDASINTIMETLNWRKIQCALTIKNANWFSCEHVPNSKYTKLLYKILSTNTEYTRFWPFPVVQFGHHFVVGTDCIFEEIERRIPNPTLYPSPYHAHGEFMYMRSAHHLNKWTDKILQSVVDHSPLTFNSLELAIPHITRLLKGTKTSEFIHKTNCPHLSDLVLSSLCWYLVNNNCLNDLGRSVLPPKQFMDRIHLKSQDYLFEDRLEAYRHVDDHTSLVDLPKRYIELDDLVERPVQPFNSAFKQDEFVYLVSNRAVGACSNLRFEDTKFDDGSEFLVSKGFLQYFTRHSITIKTPNGHLVSLPRRHLKISKNEVKTMKTVRKSEFVYLD